MSNDARLFVPPYPNCPANWRTGSFNLAEIPFYFSVRNMFYSGHPMVRINASFGIHAPYEGQPNAYSAFIELLIQVHPSDLLAQKAYKIVSNRTTNEENYAYLVEASQNNYVEMIRQTLLQRKLDCHGVDTLTGCWAFNRSVLPEILGELEVT